MILDDSFLGFVFWFKVVSYYMFRVVSSPIISMIRPTTDVLSFEFLLVFGVEHCYLALLNVGRPRTNVVKCDGMFNLHHQFTFKPLKSELILYASTILAFLTTRRRLVFLGVLLYVNLLIVFSEANVLLSLVLFQRKNWG